MILNWWVTNASIIVCYNICEFFRELRYFWVKRTKKDGFFLNKSDSKPLISNMLYFVDHLPAASCLNREHVETTALIKLPHTAPTYKEFTRQPKVSPPDTKPPSLQTLLFTNSSLFPDIAYTELLFLTEPSFCLTGLDWQNKISIFTLETKFNQNKTAELFLDKERVIKSKLTLSYSLKPPIRLKFWVKWSTHTLTFRGT